MESQIIGSLRSFGIRDLILDATTLSDGNCFYRAVIQQINRPDIIPSYPFQDHIELRNAVVEFVALSDTVEYVNSYRNIYLSTLSDDGNHHRSWSEYLLHQQKNGSYAETIFMAFPP